MDWHYADDRGRHGPVPEAELVARAGRGEITAATLVWREGQPEWRPFAAVAHELAGGALRPCASCGRLYPESEVLRYAHVWVCAACKPQFLQKLQENARVPGFEVWRAGRRLVMYKDAALPARCVKCNAPVPAADFPRRLFSRHPLMVAMMGLVLMIIASLILSITVGEYVKFLIEFVLLGYWFAMRRHGIHIGLCARHRRWRIRWLLISWTVGLVALAILYFPWRYVYPSAFVFPYPDIQLAALLAVPAAMVVAFFGGSAVYLVHADEERLHLRGCGKAYLDGLPEWHGQ